ncbi:MAG: type II toxin-antitoxin system RelE/ParE family toxin [Bacteroidetes bacterium]|nr:type II toxin-antitoxin system RelE/ParE family toxin [Bacteroidota bacterium]
MDINARDRQKIIQLIEDLATSPRPQGCKKLAGQKSDFWRVRSGNYRIIYSIEDNILTVTVIRIGHRRDVYG